MPSQPVRLQRLTYERSLASFDWLRDLTRYRLGPHTGATIFAGCVKRITARPEIKHFVMAITPETPATLAATRKRQQEAPGFAGFGRAKSSRVYSYGSNTPPPPPPPASERRRCIPR
jgi:hypothetical protein